MQEAESIGLLKKKRIRTANSPNSALTEQPTVHKQHQPALKTVKINTNSTQQQPILEVGRIQRKRVAKTVLTVQIFHQTQPDELEKWSRICSWAPQGGLITDQV